MKFERGFKAHANAIALDVREELGVESHAPLCPWGLAAHLEIPITTLQALANANPRLAGHVNYLARRQPRVFSAITLFDGNKRFIIHNDGHAPTRQRSNLAHELAHALLLHPPHPPFCSRGQRIYNRALEAQAAWLGPVLLISNEAAQWAVANGMTEDAAARHFGVSRDLLIFRLRMSGAHRINRYLSRRAHD